MAPTWNCKTHGSAIPLGICPHVAEEIDNKRYGQFYKVHALDIWLLICEDCLHRYHLEPLHAISAKLSDRVSPFTLVQDSKYIKAFEHHEQFGDIDEFQNKLTYRCEQCIAVVQVEQARRNGEDDPFPVYEKTLNSHHTEVIEALRIQTMENFRSIINVAKSVSSYAVEAEPGTLFYPLTIRINWVATEDQQKQIVSFIDAFMQSQELNQAKILFFDKEVMLNC